jgi:hypothetical protein
MGKSKAVSSHRSPRNKDPESHAKTRSRERLGINKGVLECSGLTELWMGRERDDGKSKAVSSHRSPRNQDPQSHAKTRSRERLGINKGVLECSGLAELGMGRERVDGKIQSGVKPPQSKKQGSGLNFLIQISNFRFPHSPSPQAIDSRLPSLDPVALSP